MTYEYKCVGAPERPKRVRGVRSPSERVALAMQEIITAEAVDGWEYLRADLVPVEEKPGFFSRTQEVHRAVLVFRRERAAGLRDRPPLARDTIRSEPPASSEPDQEAAPDLRAEPRETRISLAADRDAPPPRTGRTPTGLS